MHLATGVMPVDLLSARPGGLSFGPFSPRLAVVLFQLVRTVQVGSVHRNIQAAADAEAVDRGPGPDQFLERELVQIPASKDRGVAQAASVQNAAHLASMLG